ncbi:LysR substrate-binding domain-containing protein [Pseudomonas graminis]
MNVTFKQLRVFVTIAHSGSMTRAADELSMTKGAVSQALGEMENQLGIRLFDRMHARLLINHEGKRLLPVADELLARMKGIDQLFDIQGTETQLLLGCTRTIGSFLLPNMLGEFEHRYGWLPQPTIDNTTNIVRKLSNFELDVALLEGTVTEPNIVCHPWLDDEMMVVASKSHPLASEPYVSLESLSKERWLLREVGSSSRAFFDHHLAYLWDTPQIVLSLNAYDAILSCVSNNLGLTFISRRMLEHPFYTQHVVPVNIKQRFHRKLMICHHSHKYISPSLNDWMDYSENWAITHR